MTRYLRLASVIAALGLTAAHAQDARSALELDRAGSSFPSGFARIYSIRELSDDRVLIASYESSTPILLNFRDGSMQGISREGSGPGELKTTSGLIALTNDTTIVEDNVALRWIYLAGTTPVATTRTWSHRQSGPVIRGVDRSGRVLEVVPGALGKEKGINQFTENAESLFVVVRHRAAIEASSAVSGTIDTILRVRGAYRGVRRVTRGSVNGTPIWYELRALLAAADQVALFPDGWIVVVYSDPYHVEWIAPTNARIRGPDLQVPHVTVDEAEKRAAIARRYDRKPEAFSPNDFPSWPRYLPPFLDDALVGLPDGRIAVQRTSSVKDQNVFYDIIDRRGIRADRLRLRRNERIVGFGKQSVYIAFREANDLEWLSRFPWPAR